MNLYDVIRETTQTEINLLSSTSIVGCVWPLHSLLVPLWTATDRPIAPIYLSTVEFDKEL